MRLAFLSVVLLAVAPVFAQAPANQPPAASTVVGVTVYQSSALVAREVAVPAKAGTVELIVSPLPATTVPNSLYAESAGDIRVLATRYRTRPLQETAQEELRKLESDVKLLAKAEQVTRKQLETLQANLQFVSKLEGFTAATMEKVTEKGMLNAEAVTQLSTFVMDSRDTRNAQVVALEQKLQENAEQRDFLRRQIAQLAKTSDKTGREAVIVLDKAGDKAGKVTLHYMVSAASWRPQYKVRANPENGQVEIEYLAAIAQQTGEDWTGVDVVLSTAMPMFNAAPPELAVLEVQTVAVAPRPANAPAVGEKMKVEGRYDVLANSLDQRQFKEVQQSAQQFDFKGDKVGADKEYNVAAAVAQANELMADRDFIAQRRRQDSTQREGQSVTFHLNRKLSIPWREDEQLIEVARLPFKSEWFYKAVPVLTPHVYRLADLTNNSQQVILPGEATMYLGSDFVGRETLPLVAVGQTFTAGFGVDPQIQVDRQLVEKSRAVQGGNQVQKFDYRLTISSYKDQPVKLQLWDRTPHAEGDAVNVTLANTSSILSTDERYMRDQQPKGLLRWDLTLEPNTHGPKASSLTYQYKLEYAKDAAIGNLFNR